MIGIVLVSFERGEMTQRCLASVRDVASCPYRIFLVDNGSRSFTTQSWLRCWEQDPDLVVFRLDSNQGPAAGRNVALGALPAEVDVVAMLDNDIVALPGWDQAALDALRNGADLIQPKLLDADAGTVERGPTRQNACALAANPQYLGRGLAANHPEVNREQEAVIVGGTGVFRRELLDQIGLLDERLHVGEDFDWSFRAREAGFSLRYAPRCALIHDHGFDPAYDQERSRTSKYLSAHVVLWQKWRKALLSPAYLAWYDWLDRHGEPMYLPADQRWRIAHRRLRRRLARRWIMTRYANAWSSAPEADRATSEVAARLGLA
jgi:GT2 family glycosyltransferase